MKLCVTVADFLEKKFTPKIAKMYQKWAKNMVFWIYWKIWSLICTMCSVPAQILYFVIKKFLRYGPKCPQPLQDCRIAVFNHISRKNQWNSLIFCMLIQIHIKLRLIKTFLGEHSQKWVWPVWSWDSKIDCISRMNKWNELIFACWCKFSKAKSYFNDLWLTWPTWCSVSMSFKCQSIAVALIGPSLVAGRVLWNRFCCSFHPVVCLGIFIAWIIRFLLILTWC